jgi:small subunit ribosomal protein S2
MKEYIFGERNGIYIIDLQKTQKLFRDALNYVTESLTERPNQKVLFVGTKRQAQDAIKEEAERCGQFYINNRWLGGLLTNYETVKRSIQKLKDIESMREDGRFEMLTKKERLKLDREHEGLMKNLAGIKNMNGMPDMMFVIDVRKEDIAIKEANRLNIPSSQWLIQTARLKGSILSFQAMTMLFVRSGFLPHELRMRLLRANRSAPRVR